MDSSSHPKFAKHLRHLRTTQEERHWMDDHCFQWHSLRTPTWVGWESSRLHIAQEYNSPYVLIATAMFKHETSEQSELHDIPISRQSVLCSGPQASLTICCCRFLPQCIRGRPFWTPVGSTQGLGHTTLLEWDMCQIIR